MIAWPPRGLGAEEECCEVRYLKIVPENRIDHKQTKRLTNEQAMPENVALRLSNERRVNKEK